MARKKVHTPTAPISAKRWAPAVQWALLKRLVAGEPREMAARAVGLPLDEVEEVLSHPASHKWLRARLNSILLADGAPRAVRVLIDLATNEQVPPHVRRLAASDIMSRAGFGPAVAAAVDDAPTKTAGELTTDELHALISDLQGEIAGRAVDVAPEHAPETMQVCAGKKDSNADLSSGLPRGNAEVTYLQHSKSLNSLDFID